MPKKATHDSESRRLQKRLEKARDQLALVWSAGHPVLSKAPYTLDAILDVLGKRDQLEAVCFDLGAHVAKHGCECGMKALLVLRRSH